MATADIVRETLANHAQAAIPADPETSLFETGVIDSFGLLDVVADLESRFGIRVPDSEMVPRRFETIAKICAYVDSRRNG
ncbi:MAG TPA: acyl carrier protein [Acidobacteriota bacterium]|nr:acyl carrier protein [bacterium]HNX20087.1 acyl carrier protein [Acidobacteriota bacterium]